MAYSQMTMSEIAAELRRLAEERTESRQELWQSVEPAKGPRNLLHSLPPERAENSGEIWRAIQNACSPTTRLQVARAARKRALDEEEIG